MKASKNITSSTKVTLHVTLYDCKHPEIASSIAREMLLHGNAESECDVDTETEYRVCSQDET